MPDQPLITTTACPRRSRQALVRLLLLVVVSCAVGLARPALDARAQEPLCFADQAPAITSCVEGRFRSFWEEQGGLPVFGYPLGDAELRITPDGTFLTQFFERARFELHPDLPAPYDVLLGRLGVERLRDLGRDWTVLAPEEPAPGCDYWPETRHNVCGAFLSTWRAAGLQLDDDPALSDAERLALWGLPITGRQIEQTPAGEIQVQWFERARFEQQPSGIVTIGLLGREILTDNAPRPVAPTPAPAPPAPPPPAAGPAVPTPVPPVPGVPFPSVPCNVNVPSAVEGLQVWMANPTPLLEEDAVACVRLIVGGQVVNGANAMTYRYIGDERIPSIPHTTALDGVASFIFYIQELGQGRTVPVEAVVSYRGVTYSTFTSFTTR